MCWSARALPRFRCTLPCKIFGAGTHHALHPRGTDTAVVCRELDVWEAMCDRWRNQFGGLMAEDAKRLEDVERENTTFRGLFADAALEKTCSRRSSRETAKPGTRASSRSFPAAGAVDQRAARGCGCRGLAGWSGTIVSRYGKWWLGSIAMLGAA
jgi:hypothetical protein